MELNVILAEIDKSLILTGIMRSHRCWDWSCVAPAQFDLPVWQSADWWWWWPGRPQFPFPVSVEQTMVLSGGVQSLTASPVTTSHNMNI